ncbi:hypothetical protein PC9H_010194 [Pleurotus ostreatus]|uniref:Uncharacterized protein n=1 Tax=Pleurotus ostreatus TaxID=5322 RepID=A0A8H6ZNB6_PLEOS|nr:uncharacterized protein PC9H_010194 [Pleurotus ostreatus]KAF7424883.1 hypothetical protein PC9H_010194 [Pleurotus ostreatus]
MIPPRNLPQPTPHAATSRTGNGASPRAPTSTANTEKLVADQLALESRKRRRGKNANKENDNVDAPDVDNHQTSYQSYGRYVARLIDFFQVLDRVVDVGIRSEVDSDMDDAMEEDAEKTNKDYMLEDWSTCCRVMPDFRKTMLSLAQSLAYRHELCRHVALKDRLPSFILFDTKQTLDPPISSTGNKNDRGWRHPITATLLCPIDKPATNETFKAYEDGALIVSPKDLPRFLYPHDQAYNPEDLFEGVFRGHLLIRAAKCILIGRSCAVSRPGFSTRRRGNAALAGITTVNPRIIAYIVVQVRFALTSEPEWGRKDSSNKSSNKRSAAFDYHAFYRSVLSALEDDEEGMAEIIGYWNYELWGSRAGADSGPTHSGSGNSSDDDNPGEESALDRLKAQRAAKRARLTAQPAT